MRERTPTHANRWVGSAFAAFGVLLTWATFNLPASGNLGDPGPGFLPRAIGGLFILLGVILALRPGHSAAADGSDDAESDREPLGRPLLSAVAALLFIPALNLVGFVPATLVYLIAAMWILSPRRLAQLPTIIGVALIFTLSVAFALTRWLGVSPPQGTLF